MKPLSLCCLIFLCATILMPISGGVKFEHISIREGLSQSSVRSILQDRKGFMWFATVDGLNKYDGYSLTVQRPEINNINSLSSPFLRAIIQDHEGFMWVGTNGGGLNKYDMFSGNFTRFQHDAATPDSLSSDYVWAVYEDKFRRLWIGTDGGGLNRLERDTGKFTVYKHDPENPNSLSHDKILTICEDSYGMLWIGTRGGGVNKFDPKSERFVRYRNNPNDTGSLSCDEVWAVCEDRDGTIWVGTRGGGLNKFDRKTNRFTHFKHRPDAPHSLSNDNVNAILQDSQEALWVGTNGGGICKFNIRTQRFLTYRSDLNNPASLNDDRIFSIYEDRAGVLWFGTENGGANKLDRNKEHFITYGSSPYDPNSLSDDSVWGIFEEPSGILWVGTRTGGLNRVDRANGKITHHFSAPSNPHYDIFNGNYVRYIYEAPSEPGILWLAVDGAGLVRFDWKSTKITDLYKHDPDDIHSLSSDRVYTIFEDKEKNLWVGTREGGLNLLDRQKKNFKVYRYDKANPAGINDDYIYCIYQDRSGELWVGTFSGGLNKYIAENDSFIHYKNKIGAAGSISNNCVLHIFEDSEGTFWLGTGGGGLNKFDRKTKTFRHYTEADGLPNDVIYSILEDKYHNLWISTNKGLSRFNPTAEVFRNYTEKDGLQSNEFNGNSGFKSPRTNEMFFGGIRGFNAFFPERIKDNSYVPPVVITRFLVFNKEAQLKRPIWETDSLVLTHRQYVFAFEFAALDFSVPEKNLYSYKMEGLNEDWIDTASWQRFAAFTTLPAGDYTFRVRGSNNDRVWNEAGAAIKITILPPFWNTTWFKILVGLLVLALSIVLYRLKLKNLSVRTRMETELQTAHTAQMAIMPHEDPKVEGFDISGLCIPAGEVGGDFYDYLQLKGSRDRFGIVVGDVSGKAMNAAMTAVMSSGITFSKTFETDSIKDIMMGINEALYYKTEKHVFTALCLMAIDSKTLTMTFSNAGLNPPLMKSGTYVRLLEGEGPRIPLGFKKVVDYCENTLQLKKGDLVLLYSDGISESWNLKDEIYGSQRLMMLMEKIETSALSAAHIIEEIMADIKRFCGEARQHDDMTVVAVKIV
ncbi:MAG: SpoIIE family protein phosphatase [bacterium]|nr:SpoIIE family protein phosphatase [bacterium]